MTNDIGYDSKTSLPNKLLQDDGTVTDITGKEVTASVEAYTNKPALPNKFLNPDGSYSTLNEIIASMVDTSIYVIVDELPAEGNLQKIYLVPNSKGGFTEYRWTGTKWDPIGMVEFDIENYSTTEEMQQAIAAAAAQTLNSARAYTDTAIANIPKEYEWDGQKSIDNPDNLELWSKILRDAASETVLVKGPNCLFAINQMQNEPITMTYYSMARRSVLYNSPTGFEVVSVEVTTSDNNYTVSNVSGMIVNSNFSLPMYSQEVNNYTPTYNYHPATKKYVDDSIDANITQVLGGEY